MEYNRYTNNIFTLRPIESLTVFLQQLGRGLRLSEGKECLTVLDYVEQAHKNYNFEEKFRSLIGRTNKSAEEKEDVITKKLYNLLIQEDS